MIFHIYVLHYNDISYLCLALQTCSVEKNGIMKGVNYYNLHANYNPKFVFVFPPSNIYPVIT